MLMFQIDSGIVRDVYNKQPNYKIEYDESCLENVCAIYLSSNDIYFPNTEEIFRKPIVEKFFSSGITRGLRLVNIFFCEIYLNYGNNN